MVAAVDLRNILEESVPAVTVVCGCSHNALFT